MKEGGCHQEPPGCSSISGSTVGVCKLDTFLQRTGNSMNHSVTEVVIKMKARRINQRSREEWMAVQFHPVNRTQEFGVLFLATSSVNPTGPITVQL